EGKVVLLDGLEGSHALRVICDLGERCYLHASAQGRAVAAFLEQKVLVRRLREQGLVRLTPRTVIDHAHVLRRIAEDRQRGYSINWEETVEGAVCLGVPFFAGVQGGVVGSLGLSIPIPRASEMHVGSCLGHLQEAARRITDGLSGFPTEAEALPLPATLSAVATPYFSFPAETTRTASRSSRKLKPPAG
nr:hypothetical protein [Bryobacterales bacterium]